MFGVNAAGIKCKLDSLKSILKCIKPQIWSVQETKLKPNENLKGEEIDKFQMYYLNRQDSQGGGLALGVDKEIESTLVREGNDTTEAIVVQVFIEKLCIKIIVGYGPQENATKEKKEKFWEFIEEEANKAEIEDQGLIIQMDGNLHAGPELVKNDPNKQNNNGKLFQQFLQRNPNLFVANNLNICQGTITRQRVLENRTERAILDFFVMNDKLQPFLSKLIIDEERNFCLSNFSQFKQNKKVVETDHNMMIADFDITVPKRNAERIEVFNLKNKACQELFTKETNENTKLMECLENELPFNIQSKNWLKEFNNILYKCFRKVRVANNDKKKDVNENLMNERIELKREAKLKTISEEMKVKIEERIYQIEETIGEEISERYYKEIMETLKEVGGDEHNLRGPERKKLWEMLKRKYPKCGPKVPVGKKDKAGNLISNHAGLKELYLQTYMHRLRNRPIKDDFQEIKTLKDNLFELRLRLANSNKSAPWTMDDLELVLKNLRQGKARDPNGWVNDLFRNNVAGKYLKMSMLKLFNKMKSENYIPEFIRLADVATIYKGKGEKSNLENDRGIFLVTEFRSILMRLMYLDTYSEIDSNMSDSQVGGRKGKNVRNHIWVLNGVISDVLSTKKKTPIDLQIYDYKQCFDSLWLQECMNDMYDSGVKNDKLALLYNVNTEVKMAVKTPVGKTRRGSIYNVITQGDVFGPLVCSNQVDTFGKECLVDKKYTYTYKGEVEIPPLGMVDDLICISECGHRSAMMNEYISYKTNSKKLQFGGEKCKKLHVGKVKDDFRCQDLAVDKWAEVEIRCPETGEIEMEDILDGQHTMEEKEEEKYLGDIVSIDGKNIKNIKARIGKGNGIVKKIFTLLEGIPFGKRYFEIALILRNSFLVSSVLFNSEAWYNLTEAELNLLETIDLIFLRKLMQAPKGTPQEMFYLELGCRPFRDIIRERRLGFLHYILNQDPKSMINRFFHTQLKKRSKRDWVSTVLRDLEYLGMKGISMEEIRHMKKSHFMKKVKEEIQNKTFEKLQKVKSSHSKVEKVEHNTHKIQKYLQPNKTKISKEEAQLIFRLRCRVTEVKINFRGKYDNMDCRACDMKDETQQHILECEEINKNKMEEDIKYEKIFNGTVIEKLKVAKKFKENFDILEKMKK